MKTRSISKCLMVLTVSLGLSVPAYSKAAKKKVETPTMVDGAAPVSAKDAKTMFDSGDAVFVDCRKKQDYADGRIKGAISIPYKEKSGKKADYDASKDKFKLEKSLKKLSDPLKSKMQNKGTKIVTYCNGKFCWKSYKCTLALKKLGYTNVSWLRGGLGDWREANPGLVEK